MLEAQCVIEKCVCKNATTLFCNMLIVRMLKNPLRLSLLLKGRSRSRRTKKTGMTCVLVTPVPDFYIHCAEAQYLICDFYGNPYFVAFSRRLSIMKMNDAEIRHRTIRISQSVHRGILPQSIPITDTR